MELKISQHQIEQKLLGTPYAGNHDAVNALWNTVNFDRWIMVGERNVQHTALPSSVLEAWLRELWLRENAEFMKQGLAYELAALVNVQIFHVPCFSYEYIDARIKNPSLSPLTGENLLPDKPIILLLDHIDNLAGISENAQFSEILWFLYDDRREDGRKFTYVVFTSAGETHLKQSLRPLYDRCVFFREELSQKMNILNIPK